MELQIYPRMFRDLAMDLEASGLHPPSIHQFSHTQPLHSLSVREQALTGSDQAGHCKL